jgi:hypothetical protein
MEEPAELRGRRPPRLNTLRPDVARARAVASIIVPAFTAEGLFGQRTPPEAGLPPGVAPGSTEHFVFLTLTVALDTHRNAVALWESARLTHADPETHFLYEPAAVATASEEQIADAMRRHDLARRLPTDARVWQTLARTLLADTVPPSGHLSRLLERASGSATRLLALARERPDQFATLADPKLGALWTRLLADHWRGAPLTDLDAVDLPVDLNTAAATVMTGCLTGDYIGPFAPLAFAVAALWRDACQDLPYIPLHLDEPLWHLSRYGCRCNTAAPCPVLAACPVAALCANRRLIRTYARDRAPEVTIVDV